MEEKKDKILAGGEVHAGQECLALLDQSEKMVPYILADVYGGNRPSLHPMLRRKKTNLVLDLMFIDCRL
jgi:hypothetical protein